MSIWLDKVQDVTCKFGILGRIFGFGDIEIESAGTYGKIVFGFLPKPRKLRERIEKATLEVHQPHPTKCRKKVDIKNPTQVTMKNGRLAVQGNCPNCNTKVFRIGRG